MSKLVFFIWPKLDKVPQLRRLADTWYNPVATIIWRVKLRIKSYDQGFDLDKTYWVDPAKIIYAEQQNLHIYKDKGKVIGGNWDLPENMVRFEDTDVYQTFHQRYINGKSWNETDFYHRVLGQISEGIEKWSCKSKTDFNERCKNLDKLYQKIKNDGYKTQEELIKENGYILPRQIEDEVVVSIGRNGDLILSNGRHRLSIAKILGIDKIPVRIVIRHKEWIEFRKQLLDYVNQHGGKLYDSLPHPDFNDIKSHYDTKRYEIIKRNLSIKKGTLLDIGAHFGSFCHRFEEEGFDCYAVENDYRVLYFMRRLRTIGKMKFKIIDKSIFDYRDKNSFDIVLALNIFHHFIKKEQSYKDLIALLKRLKMKELYFQAHNPKEGQMKGAYRNYNPGEFVEFLLKYSCLDMSRIIGKTDDQRVIYKLYR